MVRYRLQIWIKREGKMIAIIGDIHGELEKIYRVITRNLEEVRRNRESLYIIVLGDVGLNFYLNGMDIRMKRSVQRYINDIREDFGIHIDLLLVRGNHDCPPKLLYQYKLVEYCGGKAYVEASYSNLFFLKEGEMYIIENKSFLCIGGGNSADYFSRILNDYPFFNEEGLDEEERKSILYSLELVKDGFYIISHMLPKTVSPDRNDLPIATKSVEEFLDSVYEKIKDKKTTWFAGHYHKDLQHKADNTVFNILYNNSIVI